MAWANGPLAIVDRGSVALVAFDDLRLGRFAFGQVPFDRFDLGAIEFGHRGFPEKKAVILRAS